MCDARIRIMKREYEDRIELAWWTAALSRQPKLPALASLTNTEAPKAQSDEAMMAKARLLNAAFGGIEVEA